MQSSRNTRAVFVSNQRREKDLLLSSSSRLFWNPYRERPMSNKHVMPEQANKKFLAKLKEREIDVTACYQCGRCSSGCPISDFFDLSVMEIVRLAAYGAEDTLLKSKTIWLCAACETCASRVSQRYRDSCIDGCRERISTSKRHHSGGKKTSPPSTHVSSPQSSIGAGPMR